MIVVQQATKSFGSLDVAIGPQTVREWDRVLQALMIAFMMIVRCVFFQDVAQRFLAKQNQAAQAFLFDGSDESFCRSEILLGL